MHISVILPTDIGECFTKLPCVYIGPHRGALYIHKCTFQSSFTYGGCLQSPHDGDFMKSYTKGLCTHIHTHTWTLQFFP